jgi:hypothetical protein
MATRHLSRQIWHWRYSIPSFKFLHCISVSARDDEYQLYLLGYWTPAFTELAPTTAMARYICSALQFEPPSRVRVLPRLRLDLLITYFVGSNTSCVCGSSIRFLPRSSSSRCPLLLTIPDPTMLHIKPPRRPRGSCVQQRNPGPFESGPSSRELCALSRSKHQRGLPTSRLSCALSSSLSKNYKRMDGTYAIDGASPSHRERFRRSTTSRHLTQKR